MSLKWPSIILKYFKLITADLIFKIKSNLIFFEISDTGSQSHVTVPQV